MTFPEAFRFQPADRRFHTKAGDRYGAFSVPAHKAIGRRTLYIIACDGQETGWEHVSVSLGEHIQQVPTWAEMCLVKSLFWDDSECVVEFHPAQNDYVNVHPGCLHLWKSVAPFPMPPKICV